MQRKRKKKIEEVKGVFIPLETLMFGKKMEEIMVCGRPRVK